QPDRRLALARRARRPGRLRSRRARARPGPRGPGEPPVTRRRWFADLARLPGQGVCRDVLIEAGGDRFTAVTPAVSSATSAARLRGLTLPGFANAHSHACHRALRGITQADRGTF